MKEIRCPFCGRENTRGKFCMFCGNPLSGAKPAGKGADASGVPDAEQRWDPETAYTRSKGKTAVLVIVVAALLAVAAAICGTQAGISGRSGPFEAPIGTPGANNLQEITEVLRKAGMVPAGNTYEFAGNTYQPFEPSVILGETTSYSMATVQEGAGIGVFHAFDEEYGDYSIDRPGPVLERLKKELTKRFGNPEITETGEYLFWKREGDILALFYGYSSGIILEFYREPAAAPV